jgi:glycogen debranching enzyme
VAWDTSFSSRLIAQLDPQGLMGMIEAFLRSGGALNSTYLNWTGKSGGWYAQSPFALMEIVCDYLRQTGKWQSLDTRIGEYSLLDYLKQAGMEFLSHYTQPNGLIDIGEGTGKMLEIRTFGYEHTIAAINALAVDYFHQLNLWCAERNDQDAKLFQSAAARIESVLNNLLWDEEAGWYGNLHPDGTRTMVYSYHAFDMLRTSAVPSMRKRRMAERIRQGEFIAPYGMYSISLSDHDHWDMEDCDWGGGGQYVGQTLRIADNLYACEEAERAWQLLSRCTEWVECFPYFPQTIYGDLLKLQEHQIDFPLQISSGAGAQAVIGGVFGLRPQFDGSLEIGPSYNPTLGQAKLTGYSFRGHVYDVSLAPQTFFVLKDGKLAGKRAYPSTVTLPA